MILLYLYFTFDFNLTAPNLDTFFINIAAKRRDGRWVRNAVHPPHGRGCYRSQLFLAAKWLTVSLFTCSWEVLNNDGFASPFSLVLVNFRVASAGAQCQKRRSTAVWRNFRTATDVVFHSQWVSQKSTTQNNTQHIPWLVFVQILEPVGGGAAAVQWGNRWWLGKTADNNKCMSSILHFVPLLPCWVFCTLILGAYRFGKQTWLL